MKNLLSLNKHDQLHRVAYRRQWEFTVRQLAVGGFIGGLIALINRVDLGSDSGFTNVLGTLGALFAALAMTFASEAELQSRRDGYRQEREALLADLLTDMRTFDGESQAQALASFRELESAGAQRDWHHVTLRLRRERTARLARQQVFHATSH